MNSIKNVINNRLVDCDIRYNEPMSKHTSFGIGGCASCLIFPKTISQVKYLLRSLNKTALKYYIIGSGTNMLISDSGYNGVIISLKKTFKSIDIDNDIITVESGVMLGTMVKEAVKRNIGGLESLGGVPGTVGGALYMNAGAFGSEISNYFKWAITIDMDGNQKKYYKDDIDFSYRFSTFPDNEIITKSRFKFFIGKSDVIKKVKLESSNKRKKSQPLKFRSAGSIFKNPNKSIAAGYLIDQAGLKGCSKGDAEISTKHANFIINKGSASYKDVLFLIDFVRKKVRSKFDINLELEVKLIS